MIGNPTDGNYCSGDSDSGGGETKYKFNDEITPQNIVDACLCWEITGDEYLCTPTFTLSGGTCTDTGP